MLYQFLRKMVISPMSRCFYGPVRLVGLWFGALRNKPTPISAFRILSKKSPVSTACLMTDHELGTGEEATELPHREVFRSFADGLAARLDTHPAARIRLVIAR